jgi:hypothetical protein
MNTLTHIKFPKGTAPEAFEALSVSKGTHPGFIDVRSPDGDVLPLEVQEEPDPSVVDRDSDELVDLSPLDELAADPRLMSVARGLIEYCMDKGLTTAVQIESIVRELSPDEVADLDLAKSGIEAAIVRRRIEEARDSQPRYGK